MNCTENLMTSKLLIALFNFVIVQVKGQYTRLDIKYAEYTNPVWSLSFSPHKSGFIEDSHIYTRC